MLKRLVNLTGHPLTVTSGNKSIRLRSEGRARINSSIREVGDIEIEGLSIPVLELQEKSIEELPEPEEGVIYIVSGIVATAAQRDDVMAPSRINRDQGTGRVKDCKAFIRPNPLRKATNGLRDS